MDRQSMTAQTAGAPPTDDRTTVLHVRVMAGTGGGPEKTILRSPRHADTTRWRMEAAYITPTGNMSNDALRQKAEALDCPLHIIEERGPVDPRTVRQLGELCDRLNVRIWHGHDYKSNLIGLLLRRRRPMKLMTTVHLWTDETWRLKLYRHVDQWTLPRYDRVITVSPALADRCRDIGVASDKVMYIPNAIEPHLFQRTTRPAEARRALGLDPSRPTIGFVGRLSKQKRIDRLFEVLPQLRRRIDGLQVLLVGDGALREPLERQCDALELRDTVRFCGWQDPLHRWYEAMDMTVLPSDREGLPNVLLEAMALRVPVAATPVGANPDLLDWGRCGVLLDKDNNAWIEPIARMMTDPAMRNRYADLAHRRIESRFSFESRMQRMMGEYDALLGRAPTPRDVDEQSHHQSIATSIRSTGPSRMSIDARHAA